MPLLALALLVALLSGCVGRAAGPEAGAPSPIARAHVTATLAPTFTPTLPASPTPYPTYTPYPTNTPYPTYTPVPTSTATAVPTRTPIVVAPIVSSDWPTTIRQAADALGGDATALQANLTNAGAITSSAGRVQAIDLTHDGEDDLLVWYVDPARATTEPRGNVLLLTQTEGRWRPLFDATFGAASADGATLLTAQDLNGDKRNELAYALTSCGATSCTTQIHVVSWGGGGFRDLTASDIRLPSLRDAAFSDGNNDGRFDMALTSAGSAASGPSRERTDIYAWQNGLYAFQETLYAATDWLPLVVWEAGDALDAGDYEQAALIYARAASDAALRPWAGGGSDPAAAEAEQTLLRSFSRFRLILAYAAQGKQADAQQALAALRTAYPNSPFRMTAERFIARWQPSKSLGAGCAAANEYAASTPDTAIDPLNQFGVSAPRFTAADICPLR